MNNPDLNKTASSAERLSALRARGDLSQEQAELLGVAMAESATLPQSPKRRPTTTDSGALYLQGEIDRAEFERRGRRAAIASGAMFGLIMFAMWTLTSPSLWFVYLPVWGFGGLAFGWIMNRILIRPTVEKHIALRQASGGQALQPMEATDIGQCTQCRAESYTEIGPNSGAMLHWQINPGLAFNELVLGQRIPETMRKCNECGTYSIDCAACRRSIPGSHWSSRNAFGHWSALSCPFCDAEVPTLSNWCAAIVRAPVYLVGRMFRGTKRQA